MEYHKNNKPEWQHNPSEFAICGYSNSGKTTLFEKLIKVLSATLSVGYLKHDGHKFVMDKPGKDTYKAKQAGASTIVINDTEQWAHIADETFDKDSPEQPLVSSDIVLIEGYKNSSIPKMLLLDSNGKMWKEFTEQKYENVQAIIYSDQAPVCDLPSFHRNQHDEIAAFIKTVMVSQQTKMPLNGLLLSGGKSTRMGCDKASIAYNGKDQIAWGNEILSSVCDTVFLSERPNHSRVDIPIPILTDSFLNMGPLGGILTALHQDTSASWLVLACDLPFVTQKTLQHLVEHRNRWKYATAFKSVHDNLPEPLCTIYEPKSFGRLLSFFARGFHSPRIALSNSRVELLQLDNPSWLENANTPEERDQVLKQKSFA